ncbi:hypothetical protein O3G_MSEX008529 [Manduca sexta]|uniref:DDE-1 domain-containing protein n=1 Tax=Manduca sexta TaxID=7130 RepID=A0A921ZAE4_MANSE|nr:hypothetical protein O3G_MSEX008529 [Manduca sexta]
MKRVRELEGKVRAVVEKKLVIQNSRIFLLFEVNRHVFRVNRNEEREKRFNDNMPGSDFSKSFLKRHNDKISQRVSQNIKRNRTAVSPEIINAYFEQLKISLNDIPITNVVNYDETNLADDPGRKKIITKRGTKYPERVMNHSKAAVSIMIACTAVGELLPPYVVYKSENVYDTWTKSGPKGCRYNRSQSGWFDANIFEDWVTSIILPFFAGKEGKKCLIEPLDVAFFRPMKMA